MKKTLHFFIATFIVALAAGCSKDENDPPKCETNNFGVAKLTFANNTVPHIINAGFADKTVPAGRLTDTFRLVPGVHLIKIHSTAIVDTLAYSVVITKCEESVLAIP